MLAGYPPFYDEARKKKSKLVQILFLFFINKITVLLSRIHFKYTKKYWPAK
jgi:hypothetical protein